MSYPFTPIEEKHFGSPLPVVLPQECSLEDLFSCLKTTDALYIPGKEPLSKAQLQAPPFTMKDPADATSLQFPKDVVFPVTASFKKMYNPRYRFGHARVKSFNAKWEKSQTPEQMAEAGLYYINVEDKTKCFACGKGLSGWWDSDDPVIEHIRFSPTCPFLLITKGEAFINHVLDTQRRPPKRKESDPVFGRCKICYDAPAQVSFSPCGHIACCVKCSPCFDTCPVCRTVIDQHARVELDFETPPPPPR